MTYQPPAKLPDPKPKMVDCTDMPEIIAATERGEFRDPIGGYVGGRFLVTADSLRQYREHLQSADGGKPALTPDGDA